MYAARYSVEHVFLTRVLFEYVMLAVLWLLQTGGVAAGLVGNLSIYRSGESQK